MSTSALRTTLLVLLSLYVLSSLFYLFAAFDLEQLGYQFSNPDVFDMAHLALTLTQAVVVCLAIAGLVRAIKQQAAQLPNILHFPLIWFFTGGLFSLGFRALHRSDPMRPELAMPWWTWLYTLLFLVYATACVMYFSRERKAAASAEPRWVGSWSRLFAYLLDILLVMTLFFVNLRALAFGNSVLDDYPFFNDSPYPIMSIILFIYFFANEAVFGRTLGKAANGSFVVFERGRVLSVLWRTLSRFLPFEAFSFIGRSEGWHDTLSSTTVRQAAAVATINEDGILRADQLV